jgi:hypothetical protein
MGKQSAECGKWEILTDGNRDARHNEHPLFHHPVLA